jgi:hypothetical protein
MTWVLIAISAWLTWTTFKLARATWKDNRGAGLVIALMSGLYLPISFYLYLR